MIGRGVKGQSLRPISPNPHLGVSAHALREGTLPSPGNGVFGTG